MVGQETAPSKCVPVNTSRAVRSDMRGWIVTDEGDRWSVKLDVRDFGGHLDTTVMGWWYPVILVLCRFFFSLSPGLWLITWMEPWCSSQKA